MKKSLLAAILVLFACTLVFAEDEKSAFEWSFSGELNLAPSVRDGDPRVYDDLNTRVLYDYRFLHLVADLSLINDLKYSPAEEYWFGRYYHIHEGGLVLDFDLLSFRAGKFIHRDIVDSPYSVFISAQDQQPAHWLWQPGLPATLAELTFRAGRFVYQSRWIPLNTNSAAETTFYPDGYPDRGANYKVFALEFGDWRFGVQDSAVYVDRIFDVEYFFSPMPHIFTQIARDDGKPWSETINDNTLMGLFAERRRPLHYLYVQWLVDDISLAGLMPEFLKDMFDKNTKIPSKFAWSLGGYYDFPFGRLGFYHAGATKYTFSPNTDWATYPYGYTYYPDVEYALEDGTLMTLQPIDNYIGYKYGENNLAFLISWSKAFSDFELGASLEYVVSGSKSPANPWHEYTSVGETGRDTLILDDDVLEHTATARIAGSWRWRYLKLYSLLRLGGVFNKLELVRVDPGDGGPYIFRPHSGEHELVYQLTIGATVQYDSRR